MSWDLSQLISFRQKWVFWPDLTWSERSRITLINLIHILHYSQSPYGLLLSSYFSFIHFIHSFKIFQTNLKNIISVSSDLLCTTSNFVFHHILYRSSIASLEPTKPKHNQGLILDRLYYVQYIIGSLCTVGGQHLPILTCFVPLQDCRGIGTYSTS